jgi:hypothetical protein
MHTHKHRFFCITSYYYTRMLVRRKVCMCVCNIECDLSPEMTLTPDTSCSFSWIPQEVHTPLYLDLENMEAKADVRAQDKVGRTALHLAAGNGHVAPTRALVEAKADVNKHDNLGLTALHMAAENGHAQVIEHLVEAKADVNSQDHVNRTALHMAAEGSSTDKMASFSAVGGAGATPVAIFFARHIFVRAVSVNYFAVF